MASNTLLFGHDGRIARNHILASIAAFVAIFLFKIMAVSFGGPEFVFSGIFSILSLIIIGTALSYHHALQNDGILVSILVVFTPAFAAVSFDRIFEIGHPLPSWISITSISIGVSLFVGGVGYLGGKLSAEYRDSPNKSDLI